VVIADEIHDSLTFEYSKFYENNNYAALIGLSATVDRNRVINEEAVEEENVDPIKKGFLLDQYAPSIYQLSQSQAIAEGLIAGYEICVLYHRLDESKKTMTGGTKAKPFKTTEKSAYDFVDNRFKKALFIQNARTKKFQLSHWSRKRAAILYDLPSKIAVLKQLEQLAERKIIFGNSLDALLEVTPNVVSSRNSEEENKLIRDNFEKGKTNTIASFKKLKQGANIPDVKLGILHSYYSTVKDYIQRLGRVLRLDGDKQAKVVVFVTIGTKEQDWFDKMTQEIDAPVRGFTKIDDLIKYLQE
jgi:superfamily II DNA or RNA helicase